MKDHIKGPLGVRGRNSNNDLIREKLNWDYQQTLEEGISNTYKWIEEQIKSKKLVGNIKSVSYTHLTLPTILRV